MKTTQASIMGLLTLILVVGIAGVEDARADVKVRATLTTPHVRFQVSNTPSAYHRYMVRGQRPYAHRVRYEVNKRDRKMAKRLAQYTGIPKRELVDLKRYGYSWREIGRWYDIPNPVIRAASDARRWKRFLERGRHHARKNYRGHGDRRYGRIDVYDD